MLGVLVYRYTQLGFLNDTVYRGVCRRMLRHPDASMKTLFSPQIEGGGGGGGEGRGGGGRGSTWDQGE